MKILHFGGESDLKRTSDDHTGQQVFGKLLLLLLFTVDSNCYLVAYQELLTIRGEPGCIPEEGNLVAYQKKRTWLRTRRREPGCVPEEENLVAYQKKGYWLRTKI